MRNLGLHSKSKNEELYGFSPGMLNEHSAVISVSNVENIVDAMYMILFTQKKGFIFNPITINEEVRAISNFFSQAEEIDGISRKVVIKALPAIDQQIVYIFNTSFAQWFFLGIWNQSRHS